MAKETKDLIHAWLKQQQVKLLWNPFHIRHTTFQTVMRITVLTLMATTAHISWLIDAPQTFAGQLIEIGKNMVRAQSIESPTKSKSSTDTKNGQILPRKPHKLIRKPHDSTASIDQIPPVPSTSASISSTTGTTSQDSSITQTKDSTTTTTTSSGTSLIDSPRTALSATTTTASASLGGAISSPTGQTSYSQTAVAGAAGSGSSASGLGYVGGRGMQKLMDSLPGLTQLLAPTTLSTAPPAPVPPAIGASPTSLSFTAQQGGSSPAAQTVSISGQPVIPRPGSASPQPRGPAPAP